MSGEVEQLDLLAGGDFGFPLPDNNAQFSSALDESFWPPMPAPTFPTPPSGTLVPQTTEEKLPENPRKRFASQLQQGEAIPQPRGPIKTKLIYEFSTPLPNRWKYSMSVWNLKTMELVACDSDFVNLLEIPVSVLSRNYKWPDVFPMNAMAYPAPIRAQVAASGRRLHFANNLMIANRVKFINHNLAMISGTGRLKFLHLVVAVVDDKDGNPCEGFCLSADVTEAGAFPIPEDPLPGHENDPTIVTHDPSKVVNVVPCELPPAPTGFNQTSISRPYTIPANSPPSVSSSSSDSSSEPTSPSAVLTPAGGTAMNVASSFSTPSGSTIASVCQDIVLPSPLPRGSRVYSELPFTTAQQQQSVTPTPLSQPQQRQQYSPPTMLPANLLYSNDAPGLQQQQLPPQSQHQFSQQSGGLYPPSDAEKATADTNAQLYYMHLMQQQQQQHQLQMQQQQQQVALRQQQQQQQLLRSAQYANFPNALSSSSQAQPPRPLSAPTWPPASSAPSSTSSDTFTPQPNAAASAYAALPSSAYVASADAPEAQRVKPWEENVVKFKWKRPQKWTNMPTPAQSSHHHAHHNPSAAASNQTQTPHQSHHGSNH